MRALPDSNDHHSAFTAMQEGKWDAAFAALGNPAVGFNFKGSPFGQDAFDYWPSPLSHQRYRNVFTGFIFFKSLDAQRMSIGLPDGLYDHNFADVLQERFRISGEDLNQEEIETMFRTVHIFGYDFGHASLPDIYKSAFPYSDYPEKIQRWLLNAK